MKNIFSQMSAERSANSLSASCHPSRRNARTSCPRSVVKIICTALFAALLATDASAQTTFTTNITVNTAVPDNNPSGLASGFSLAGLDGAITNLSVTLNLAGGYNGDLFASLVGPGGFAVLLNRVGVSGGNPNGYGDTGLAVTFHTGAAPDIHGYGGGSFSANGSGQVTGSWSADGRNISPLSAGSAFDLAGRTSLLDSFLGSSANGNWGLFIGDYSAGDISTLASYTVSLTTVPEPGTLAIFALGGAALLAGRRKNTAH